MVEKKVEKFSKYKNRPLSLETGLPSVREQKKFFSPNWLKVVPFDSSRCAEQVLLKNNQIWAKKFFCSPTEGSPVSSEQKLEVVKIQIFQSIEIFNNFEINP